jgi:ankyrin repeat protein
MTDNNEDDDAHLSGVSPLWQLHESIREGDFSTTHMIVSANPEMLWHPNSIGWTALHFAAIHQDKRHEWLWMVSQALKAKGRDFINTRTDLGHSCIDLWLARYLQPFRWQPDHVQEEAALLNAEIEKTLSDEDEIALFKDKPRVLQLIEGYGAFIHRDLGVAGTWARSPAIIPRGQPNLPAFWLDMETLLRAATLDAIPLGDASGDNDSTFCVLHALAKTGCPPVIARLAVALLPEQIRKPDKDGNLPLHVAALAAVTTNIVYEEGHPCPPIILALLRADPDAAGAPNRQGHLPLHLALASGNTSQETIQVLIDACPAALHEQSGDGLLAFALAAIPHDPSGAHARAKRQACRSIGGMFRFLPVLSQRKMLKEAMERDDLSQATVIFELLRAFPAAVQLSK